MNAGGVAIAVQFAGTPQIIQMRDGFADGEEGLIRIQLAVEQLRQAFERSARLVAKVPQRIQPLAAPVVSSATTVGIRARAGL